jgi:hypothetical protein
LDPSQTFEEDYMQDFLNKVATSLLFGKDTPLLSTSLQEIVVHSSLSASSAFAALALKGTLEQVQAFNDKILTGRLNSL